MKQFITLQFQTAIERLKWRSLKAYKEHATIPLRSGILPPPLCHKKAKFLKLKFSKLQKIQNLKTGILPLFYKGYRGILSFVFEDSFKNLLKLAPHKAYKAFFEPARGLYIYIYTSYGIKCRGGRVYVYPSLNLPALIFLLLSSIQRPNNLRRPDFQTGQPASFSDFLFNPYTRNLS